MVDPNWKVPRFPYQSIAPEKTVIFHLQITNWEDKCGPQYCFAHARVDRSVNPPRFMGSINESEGNLVASWSIPIIPGGGIDALNIIRVSTGFSLFIILIQKSVS